MRTLTLEEAKSYYDRFGAKQDNQSFYEAPALRALVANGRFDKATSVFEFGCGTGRFARELLTDHLPSTAQYRGVDISATMIQLASARLASFSSRATATLVSDGVVIPVDNNSIDRFVSSYVLDLLPNDSVEKIFNEAHRALQPNGLLCLAGLTKGVTPISRLTMGVWEWLFSRNPSIVGGCRPTQLMEYILADKWQVQYRTVVVAWGIPSEIVVATPVKTG